MKKNLPGNFTDSEELLRQTSQVERMVYQRIKFKKCVLVSKVNSWKTEFSDFSVLQGREIISLNAMDDAGLTEI